MAKSVCPGNIDNVYKEPDDDSEINKKRLGIQAARFHLDTVVNQKIY